MKTSKVLVTGATRGIGALVVPALRARGLRVRAMVRTPGREKTLPEGVEFAFADLRDPKSVAAALHGVDGVFLNSPSTPDAVDLQIRFADLAMRAGVSQLVLLSQYEARTNSRARFLRWHAAVEAHVRTLGLEHTVLRPNLFMQGLLRFSSAIRANGAFAASIGAAPVSLVDTRDIADVAALVFAEPGHSGRTYSLTGPQAVTHGEIAGALSVATGRPVTFTDLSVTAFAASLRGVMPDWQAAGLAEDYAHYARGEAARVHPDVADLIGRPARDLAGFAQDFAGAFTPPRVPNHV
ncbi:NAD(P)-dependent oxidoreductase [Amycolatopsis sp. WAC 01416]|uniref:SDR family oxidoreductase n=1 Tax=Amycolatopsis sp. WAC 01416 TaxID=2203196 RepID=UPI000F7974DB|nr:SDR family oxidoreductase [Amycolatopsis sp. WAC 01416]RSN30627.1 NAD(P)-dependent oxidoreductase [Amycolatopsis sp. WAC 01416]